jgi:two-component system response regulator YesN
VKKAILVDDEVFARKGLIGLIPWAKLGYEIVAEAEDGEDAFALIGELRPDVVITDVRMPVLDGLQLIQKVREHGDKTTKFIIISGYGDFKYAQQAVRFGVEDYLLKPIDEDELIETLTRIGKTFDGDREWKEAGNRIIQASVFESLVIGQLDEKLLEEAAMLLGLPQDRTLRYMNVEWNDLPPSLPEDVRAERIEQAKLAVVELLALRGQSGTTLFYARSGSEFGFLVFALSETEGIRALGEELAGTLEARIEGELRIYAGASVPGLRSVKESYATMAETMSYKYALDGAKVLIYEEIRDRALGFKEVDSALHAELMESLEERDEAAMAKLADRLFEAFREQSYSPESVQASILRCLHGATGIVQTMGGDEKEVDRLIPLLQWHHEPRTLKGLKALFTAFLTECADYVSGLRSSRTRGDIGKIKSYIDAHYGENINLKSISKRFYMNPVYLGQLFRKTYGVYFNEYLLHIRITEAKKQLRQTDNKVYEIAANVGFGNADYFVCQFEKVEGRTPTEYKNAMLAKA